MVPLGQLLIPIALSALLVLVASALVWLVLPHHRRDMRRLPDEAASLEALGKQALRPGVYRFPYASDPEAVYDAAFVAKLTRGPVGLLTVTAPGPFSVGRAFGRIGAGTGGARAARADLRAILTTARPPSPDPPPPGTAVPPPRGRRLLPSLRRGALPSGSSTAPRRSAP